MTQPSSGASLPTLTYARTADDVNVAYIRVGEGSPIVFASNNCDASNYFIPESKGMTDGLTALGWEVVLHDSRGTAASDRDVADWSLEGRIRDLEAIVNRVGSRRIMLAGIDEGCPTAIAYAARNPDRVSHLVLVCPWASGAAHYALPAVRQATSPPAVGGAEWNVFTNIIGGVLTEFADPGRQRQVSEAIRTNASAANFTARCQAAAAINVSDLLGLVRAPTLVLHDATFVFASFDHSRDVAAGIGDAQLVVINESFIMGPERGKTLATIDRFLRSDAAAPQHPDLSSNHATLTRREREVLRLIAAGHANKTIASRLDMSERTAARHITNLYAKIGAHSKAAATAYAIRNALT